MRIIIDRARCQGHARCATVAGELYMLDDDGYISSDGFDVPPGMEVLAKRGAKACPEHAITVEESRTPDAE